MHYRLFGTVVERSWEGDALDRFYQHLEPGGALILDNYLPYRDAEEWRYWVKEERQKLPEPWPSEGLRNPAANGDEIELRSRIAAFDPLEQVAEREVRATLLRDGQPVKQEEYTLLECLYFRNELLAMLALAGFHDVDVLGDYTQETATSESGIIIYIARKQIARAPGMI